MTTLTTGIHPVPPADWPCLTQSFSDHNYRQTEAYGRLAAQRLHATSECVSIVRQGEIIGLANVRVRSVPLVGGGVAHISGGPLVASTDADPASDLARVGDCLRLLRREYVHRRHCRLRILPPVPAVDSKYMLPEAYENERFHPTRRITGYRTILVDLRPTLEQIRSKFRRNWRNHLRRAESLDVTLLDGTCDRLFNEFRALYRQLRDRKGFAVSLDADFYARVQRQLAGDEKLGVCIARLDSEPVAGCVYSTLGNTCVYLLGATNAAGLKSRASYLLQWHTIQRARAAGCWRYDLGGIDPEGNPGVYDFKRGMGGVEASAPGPYESAPHGLRPRLTLSAEWVYRAVRSRVPASSRLTPVRPLRAPDSAADSHRTAA